MPHFSNRNGLNFHSKSPFDLQSINSCISFLKYNLISNYVQREILYSHHSHFPKVWKSLSHYWKTSLECGISSTKRESFTEGQDHSESFQSPGLLLAFSVSSLYQVSEKKKDLEETLWIFRKTFLIILDPYMCYSFPTAEKLNSISHTQLYAARLLFVLHHLFTCTEALCIFFLKLWCLLKSNIIK